MAKYPKIEVKRKTGREPFHKNGVSLGFDLQGFWQWSGSDLVGNAMRGVLAEYIVASALGVADGIRTEWDAYDIQTQDGTRVEVKSGAYIQSWDQEKLSTIQFGIQPTLGWDAGTNTMSEVSCRQSDVYVFCVLDHTDQETIDPLDMSQWVFFVLSTDKLNQSVSDQKTITLSSLTKLQPIQVTYEGIAEAVKNAVVPGGE